ncbi:hypothetical protein [Micromonospora sp. NPDC023633]|uniref:hypothetical protein n=1 Tax=Micromonospora sp. NPDC023633 TaxID=3154320 RepID=UPI0033F69E56
MALLTASSVTGAATNVAPAAMSTSDTVSGSDIGQNGALLQVINGGGASINVTLADPGSTRVGNAGTAVAQAVPAGADRWFRLSPGHINSATGVATVTLSSAASVTYKLIRC